MLRLNDQELIERYRRIENLAGREELACQLEISRRELYLRYAALVLRSSQP